MRKKIVGLVIALLVLGGLIAAYVLVERGKAAAGADDEAPLASATPLPVLLSGDADELSTIKLRTGDSELVFVLGEGGAWEFAGAPETKLKQTALQSIARYAANTTAQITVAEGPVDNMDEFGLNPPRTVVTAVFNGGEEHTLSVGMKTPEGDRYYVALNSGGNVYAVSSYVGGLFTGTLASLVDTAPPEFDLLNLRTLYFNNGVEMSGYYDPPPEDQDASAVVYRASYITLDSPIPGKGVYLDNFNSYVLEPLKAVAFDAAAALELGGRAAEFGLDAPRLSVALEGVTVDEEGKENGAFSYRLDVGGLVDDEFSYASVGGTGFVYLVKNAELAPLFAANVYKMMDRFISIVYINDVDFIDVFDRSGGNDYRAEVHGYKDFSTSESGYDEIAPVIDGVNVDASGFRKFYQVLVGLAVDSAVSFEPVGEADVVVEIHKNDGEVLRTEYFAYGEDYFAVVQDGRCDFVIGRRYVEKMIDALVQVKNGAVEIK